MAFVFFSVLSVLLILYTITAIVYVKKLNKDNKEIPSWASLFFYPYLQISSLVGLPNYIPPPIPLNPTPAPTPNPSPSPISPSPGTIPSSYNNKINNLQCTLLSSVYNKFSSTISSTTIPSIYPSSGNTNVLNGFCSIGKQFIDNECSNELFDPTKDHTYLSFCCNNDPLLCNDNSKECITNKSHFNDMKNAFDSLNESSVGINEAALTNFCNVGNSILSKVPTGVSDGRPELSTNCVDDEFSPMKSSGFIKFCCNNSDDRTKCNSNSIKCAVDSSNYKNKLNSIKNMSIQSLLSNKEQLNDFCSLGNTVNTNCSPVFDSTFTSLCPSLQCTLDTSAFLNNDYSVKNLSIDSWESSKDTINKYCDSGYKISGCHLYDPTQSDTFLSMCCNGDKTKCSPDSIACGINSSNFSITDRNMSDMNVASISSNKDSIQSYCDRGNSLIDTNCSQIHPINSPKFRELCCNNSTDKEKCKTGISCTLKSGDFYKENIEVSGIPLSTVSGVNKDRISKYCDMGVDLLSCNTSPLTSPTFTQFCCNNSNDPSQCGQSAFQCSVDGGNFVNMDTNLSTLPISSVGSNLSSITDYCNLGEKLLSSSCNTVLPLNSPTFRTFCCNNKNDASMCNSDSLLCLTDSSRFENITNGMKNMTVESAGSNISSIKDMCSLGISLLNRKCGGTNPVNTDVFKTFCCNGSSDPSLCTPDAVDCVVNSSSFFSSDKNMNVLNMSTLYNTPSTIDEVTNYCHLGDNILSSKCKNANPLSSAGFRNLCCNTEITDDKCNDNSIQCAIDSSNFSTKDMSGMTQTNISANKQKVIDYCTVGNKLIENGCKMSVPTNTDTFRNLCCNGDTTTCNNNSLQCTLNSSSFTNKDYDLSNMLLQNVMNNIPSVTEYCAIGKELNTSGCKGVNPNSSSQFNNFCCGGSSSPEKCTDSALQCTIDSSRFKVRDAAMGSFNLTTDPTVQDILSGYCNLGYGLTSNGCGIYSPNTSSNFIKLCCNGNTDTCNSSSLQCSLDGTNFSSIDSSLSTNVSSYIYNIPKIKNYCSIGSNLLLNNCKTNPLSSSKFNTVCCNASGDSTKCNDTSVNCSLDASTFLNMDYSMSSITPANARANASKVNTYCNLGYNLVNNGCNAINPHTSNFNRICCVGDPGDYSHCNPNYMLSN